MSSEKQEPKLVELGANTREPASKKNLDVSGTVGPDYLGQQTVNVDGHSMDRPGVQNRTPEHFPDDEYAISKMDTGEELPVLLSSSMKTDPIEGTQGSYTQIVEGECARCGYDRLVVSRQTMAGVAREQCNACDAIQEPRTDAGYRMPKTDKERAKETRERNERLGETRAGEVYQLNDRAIRLISGNNTQRYLTFEDVASLTELLVQEGCIDPEDLLSMLEYEQVKDLPYEAGDLGVLDRVYLSLKLKPKTASLTTREWDTPVDGLTDDGVETLCRWLFEAQEN